MSQSAIKKLIPSLIVGAFASSAGASGFQLLEQSGSGIGSAFAGSAAVAENASTIFHNPAGMTELPDRAYSIGLALVQPSAKFRNSGTSATGVLTGDGGDAGSLAAIPNGFLEWAYSKNLRFGLGLGVPFGFKTEYDNPWTGGAQALSFDVKTINLNPSVAYRINDAVSVGGGLDWQRIDVEFKRLAAVAPLGFNADKTVLAVKLNDDAWGWNVGALFKLSSDTRLGLSYRSRVKYDADGDITASGDPVGVATVNALGKVAKVKSRVEMPDTAIASVTRRLTDRWELLGDLSWTGWSSIPKVAINYTSGPNTGTNAQTLHTDFRDTWRAALGASYVYSDTLKFKFGVAYDQTPVKGATTRLVSLPDNNRWWLSTGAQWKVTKDSTLDLGLAYLYLKDAKIDNNQAAAGMGYVNGTYKDRGLLLGLQYSAAF